MNIVYYMIPLGLVLVGFAAWAFFWAVSNGQFDDLESPGWSVLADDPPPQDRAAAGRKVPAAERHEGDVP